MQKVLVLISSFVTFGSVLSFLAALSFLLFVQVRKGSEGNNVLLEEGEEAVMW